MERQRSTTTSKRKYPLRRNSLEAEFEILELEEKKEH